MKIINISDADVSELINIIQKLNENNLYLYWLLKEKNDEILYNNMKESIEQVIEQYRKQIAKIYVLNIVEQKLLNTTKTEMNQIINSLKNKLYRKEILNENIINGLCLSNLDSIFSNSNNFDYTLVLSSDIKEENKNNKYLNSAIGYANSFSNKKIQLKLRKRY